MLVLAYHVCCRYILPSRGGNLPSGQILLQLQRRQRTASASAAGVVVLAAVAVCLVVAVDLLGDLLPLVFFACRKKLLEELNVVLLKVCRLLAIPLAVSLRMLVLWRCLCNRLMALRRNLIMLGGRVMLEMLRDLLRELLNLVWLKLPQLVVQLMVVLTDMRLAQRLAQRLTQAVDLRLKRCLLHLLIKRELAWELWML